MANIVENPSYMDFPLQIARQYDAPIEKYEVFYSMEDAENYAKGSPAYVGQTIKVVDKTLGTLVGTYTISDKQGTLIPVATGGDTDELAEDVAELQSQMSTAQTNITSLQTKVGTATLTTTGKDLSSAINELKTKTDTLDTTTVKNTGSQTITGDLTIVKSGSSSTGNLVVQGNLTVSGTTITQDTESLVVKDNMIVANSDGATLTQLSGLAIRKNATNTYGIVYDPTTDSVNLGLGTLDSSNEFTFNEGEGSPVVVRDNDSSLTNGHLIQWSSDGNKVVDSGVATSDVALKSELPTGFTVSASSNILQATGGNNSVTFNAQTSESSITGKLTVNAAGKLDFGGQISANGVTLTGNTGTVTQIITGSGLSGGTITGTGTISHAVPSGASTVNTENTGLSFIQNISTDGFGHVTNVETGEITDISSLITLKTLDTSSTSSLATNSSEELTGTGTIQLHKIAKTGSYTDLVNLPTNLMTTDTTQTITGAKTFSSNIVMTATPSANNHLVPKSYVDNLTNQIVKKESMTSMVSSGSGDDITYTYTSTSAGYIPVAVYRSSDQARVTADMTVSSTGFTIETDIDISGANAYVVCVKAA